MITRFQAMNMDTFVAHLETAICALPDTAGEAAGIVCIAHSIELDTAREGAVFSYGHLKYTHDDHTRSIAQFWQKLLDEGKIGSGEDRLKAARFAMTGNPVNDIIQIAGALHQKELAAKQERAS